MADKLDTLVGFFYNELPPTGSKDPFALRRAALGVIATILATGCRLPLRRALQRPAAYDQWMKETSERNEWQSVLHEYPEADQIVFAAERENRVDQIVADTGFALLDLEAVGNETKK